MDIHGRGSANDWTIPKAPKYEAPTYNIYPLDRDIQNSLSNLENTEGKLGQWNLPDKEDVQISVESDPICSSAGCTQYKTKKTPLGYDLDYFVPNFGVDHDILDTQKSIINSQLMHGKQWIMGTKESKAKYHNKAKDVDYNFAPELDDDVKVS